MTIRHTVGRCKGRRSGRGKIAWLRKGSARARRLTPDRKGDGGVPPLSRQAAHKVWDEPQILTMDKLISSKLSTYIGRGIDRSQDYADVVKLVQINDLPREYGVDARVLAGCGKTPSAPLGLKRSRAAKS